MFLLTLIIAHRGYRKTGEPDNSMQAFHSAIKSNADGFELDVQQTSDKKFVCFHNDTLKILGISKAINELTFNEVVSLELAEGINIPSLEEVLVTFRNKVFLNIEYKPKEEGVEELIALINKQKLRKHRSNFIISSFNLTTLKKIKFLDPEIPTGLLVRFSRNQVKIASEINCDAIHPFYEVVPDGWSKIPKRISNFLIPYYFNKCFIEATSIGMMVNPYTVNHEVFLRKSFEKSVYSVITDEVEKAHQIKKEIV
jgi:glycerophosphoryl diester phosphodiesterase